MRKFCIAFGCMLLLFSLAFSVAQDQYTVNDMPLAYLSIEELYALEDAVVDALNSSFTLSSTKSSDGEIIGTYVVNPRTRKFHFPYCYSALQIGSDRQFKMCAASELVEQGYSPCGQCKPYLPKE